MKIGYAILAAAILGLPLLGCGKDDPQGFPKVDYNKDGKVIFEELIVAFPDLTVDEFLAADADRNGSINEQEFKAFRAARKAGKKLEVENQKPDGSAQKPMTEPLGQSAPAQAAADKAAPEAATTPEAADKAPAATPAPTEQTLATPEAASAASAPATAAPAGDAVSAPAPAAPATPVSPAEPDAAASATPETPAPVATAPAAAATPEPVETIEVATGNKAAAKTTYTVQRGDSLSRIAKKCGVGVKELMAANGMKDADHLRAGASLVIPGKAGATSAAVPAGVAASPEVTRFVTEYFTRDASGDINGLIDLYNTTVEYNGKARTGSDVVRQDKAELFLRWPTRSYKTGAITSESLQNGEVRVTAPVAYTFAKGDKTQQGDIRYTLVLRPHDGGYHIVAEQRAMTIKK